MAVSPAQARASFDLKSATLPLIAVLLKTADLTELADAMQARLADTPDFFEQDPVVVDLAAVREAGGKAGAGGGLADATLARGHHNNFGHVCSLSVQN